MSDSIQSILRDFFDAASKDSETAATRVKELFHSLTKPSRDEITQLEERIKSLENEVATLKAERLAGHDRPLNPKAASPC
jgi:polyhydroxyalkanoate synthesis regulator phasin